jgi:hypothetical protein
MNDNLTLRRSKGQAFGRDATPSTVLGQAEIGQVVRLT